MKRMPSGDGWFHFLQPVNSKSSGLRSRVAQYRVAVGSIVLVAILRLLLQPVLDSKGQYMLFLLAVLGTVWWSGLAPALLALVLGAVVGIELFVEPPFQLTAFQVSDALAVLLYMLVGAAIIGVVTRLQAAEAQLEVQLAQQAEADEALRASEQRFRTTFEKATDAMALSDAEGKVLAANAAYLQLYGYPAAEVIGHSFAIIFPPERREEAMHLYRQLFNGELEQLKYESRVERRDGTQRIVESHAGFVMQQDQRAVMLSVIRDLTERKEAEETLRVRYELTSALAQATNLEAVAQVSLAHITKAIGAHTGHIFLYQATDNVFELLATNSTLTPDQLAPWRRYAADPKFPITAVGQHHQPLWFASAAERAAAYPVTAQFTHLSPGASALVPLIIGGTVFGVMSLIFAEDRTFAEAEKALVSSLVVQCAQAVERALLADKQRALAIREERQRLSRDLHDAVSQTLFTAGMIAESVPRLWTQDPQQAQEQSLLVSRLTKSALAELRTLLFELRPEGLLNQPLSQLFGYLTEAIRGRKDIDIETIIEGEEWILPPEAHVAFYRLTQEGLNNVVKHSHATQLHLQLHYAPNHFIFQMRDNGQGFDPQQIAAGFGMSTMRERAEAIGAQLQLDSEPGKGTVMSVKWRAQV